MPRKVPLMSALQIEMLERLKSQKVMYIDVEGKEAHSLRSLVKRGLVRVHELDPNGNYWKYTYWTLS